MSFDRPPYTHTITMAALLFLFWVFIPCAHTFAGVCGCSCQMRSAYQIERSRSLSPMVQSARSSRVSLERSQRGWHPRKRSRGILMGTEEVRLLLQWVIASRTALASLITPSLQLRCNHSVLPFAITLQAFDSRYPRMILLFQISALLASWVES